MGWASLDTAPRDGSEVWLFLPAASWTARADGTVTEVKHATIVAKWNGHWVNRAGNAVYPSLWHDAPVTGEAPQDPELA